MSKLPKDYEEKGSITWMANNHVAANLIMLICIIGGFLALGYVRQEVFPEVDLDSVTIEVSYPGASPEEIEKGIIQPIEEVVYNLDGVKEVLSKANEGSASVTVELLEGENLQRIADDIRNEVSRIRTFPQDAEEPQVNISSRKRQVIDLVVYGNVDRKALHYYSDFIRDSLLEHKSLNQIEVSGLPPMEISINVSQDILRKYNLTIDQIAQRIRESSVDLPFGGIKSSKGEVLLRITERKDYGQQFAQIPIITNPDGSQIILDQIATIDDSFEEQDYSAKFNNEPAVMLDIYSTEDQTPLEISEAIYQQIEQLKPLLPENIKIAIMRDRSEIFAQRVDLLLRNAGLGLILVLLVLGMFLEIRLAFWVMMGIPISFMGSLLILPFTGVSINMISLFAYIVALGIVVDDAIVIGENIYQYREKGYSSISAAIQGTKEVAGPITFSILTNVATFMPLYFMPGRMGKLFWQIPVVVSTVFLISLFESIFILPAHLAHTKNKKPTGLFKPIYVFQQNLNKAFKWFVLHVYIRSLKALLSFKYIVLTIALCILAFMIAWAASGRMGFQTFPRVESDHAESTIIMPYGVPVDKTIAIAERVVVSAQKVGEEIEKETGQPFVTGIFAEIGRGGSHDIRIRAYLVDAVQREKVGVSTNDFTIKWRNDAGVILGSEYARFASDSGGPGGGSDLTIELAHSDVAVLEKASKTLANAIAELEYTSDIDDGYQAGKQQLDFNILPKGKALRISSNYLGRQLRNSYFGAEAIRQLRGRNEIKIRVRLPKEERVSEYHLDEMIILTPSGNQVMLNEVAMWQRGYAYTSISRRDGRRVVEVTANVEPKSKALDVISRVESDIFPKMLALYPRLLYSFQGRQADQRESMAGLKNSFILALLVVYILLAIPFRSYIQPFIIMIAIPLGIVGAIWGHLIMDYSLCIPSILGIVALSGVVVNDSLVLVDCINRLKKQDYNTYDAIIEAATQRFRPIILTTATTFFGLLPMIFETSRQAKFLIPMAISLGFGILFSTVIILGLIPCLFLIMEESQRAVQCFLKFLFPRTSEERPKEL